MRPSAASCARQSSMPCPARLDAYAHSALHPPIAKTTTVIRMMYRRRVLRGVERLGMAGHTPLECGVSGPRRSACRPACACVGSLLRERARRLFVNAGIDFQADEHKSRTRRRRPVGVRLWLADV